MKKRYILLILIGLIIFYNDFRIVEYHDISFENTAENKKIKFFNAYNEGYSYDRIYYLVGKISEQPPYSIMAHVILDDPDRLRAISANIDQDILFDLDYSQIANLQDGVILKDELMGDTFHEYTLKYGHYYHESGYYTLYLNRVTINNDHPLNIKITYFGDDGDEKTEMAKTKITLRNEWGSGFLSLIRNW
ncbi:MAG: hypothetical protein R3D86_13325 [Emcibacteraceae bacterium]